MKAAIYNPYFDTLGGGERYTVGVIRVLQNLGYEVWIQWPDVNVIVKLEKRFGVCLKGLKVTDSIKNGAGFDFCFWLSDGSIPFLKAKKNFLHFQVPFQNVGGRSWLNKIKFLKVNKVIVNSDFTRRIVDEEYDIKSVVVYPPVEIKKLPGRTKEKIILSVGRFSQLKQAKRQDVLIHVFKKMSKDKSLTGWRLVLAGGAEIGSESWLKSLKIEAKGYPIDFVKSPSFEQLADLYSRATIFWSAAGYGINDLLEPDKVEHFGISVVEAMACGAVPIAFDAGGHKEIIESGHNGFLWRQEEELINFTLRLINDSLLKRKIASASIKKSADFSFESFSDKMRSLILNSNGRP